MTLVLTGKNTRPPKLEIKTRGLTQFGLPHIVEIGEYTVDLMDFLTTASYVLTNTDLETGDPRLHFIDYIKSMRRVSGYNRGRKRLKGSVTSPFAV